MHASASHDEPRDWPETGTESADDASRSLSAEQARALRKRQPMVSPWRVVAVQAICGLLCALIAWAVVPGSGAAWSALYGAASTVIPSALLARGMTRGTRNPVAAAAGFMFWEMLKIGVAIAMLVIAAKVVPQLSWPVLLVTMVVCMKVNWFALLWRGRR
ncbi:MAG: ATP synthase subunit I [Methylibium sp.]|uniref:ATP synthase subunit I n=1 Tax=Methylibium sp. TaxID=2067992 RepID=UPI0017DCCD7E|nr:ATP synthase subunit I [Methylibium sp.]MBA3598598.1 ATP synthase subunit I [Methylibium sp.]